MTESDWLTSTDPQRMLSFLRDRGPVSERKLRLFAVMCCRDISDILDELEGAGIGLGHPAILAAERLADGLATPADVRRGVADYVGLIDSGPSPESQLLHGALPALAEPPRDAATRAALHAARARQLEAQTRAMLRRGETDRPSDDAREEGLVASRANRARQADILRDTFGNPFHALFFSPEWRTEAVVSLARGIYEERLFERMPVLADALEDAGGADPELLGHCRGASTHVRGCWVVDLVLGKT